MDSDSIVLGKNTTDIIKELQTLNVLFDFSHVVENHELFGDKNKKVIERFEIESPKSIGIDEFIRLPSKAYSKDCNDKNTNKLKSIS